MSPETSSATAVPDEHLYLAGLRAVLYLYRSHMNPRLRMGDLIGPSKPSVTLHAMR
jgi:hypothetical protein